MKDKIAVDQSTINKWLKKFPFGSKNLEDQTRSGRPKIVYLKAVLQAIDANPVSSTWRVSGELGILLSGVVCQFHDLGNSIWSC